MKLAIRVPALLAIMWAPLAAGAAGSERAGSAYFTKAGDASASHATVAWDRQAIRSALNGRKRLFISRFPLNANSDVDLEIEPFAVTGPDTRFVLGRKDAPDVPLDFDASEIDLYVGRVPGKPGSHVYLALSDRQSTGYVDQGPGAARYQISSKDRDGRPLEPGRFTVFEASGAPALVPDVPLCGVDALNDDAAIGDASHAFPVSGPPFFHSTGGVLGQKMIKLAVETDYEFFSLFGDADATATYLVEMYGEVSAIYARDVNARMELVYARIWDDPDDLFNDVDPSPLPEFRTYWNDNMGAVVRDVAQLFSGRRDYPFGGQGYLSQLCTPFAYSVVGYAMGFFPDPTQPSPYNYDVSVTAHELGHNCGTGHTHDSPNFIDTCNDPDTTPQRGTIMSYCGQTWSGGNANRDSRFHTQIVQNMASYIASQSDSNCVIDDCNANGIYDAYDIFFGGAADANGNGVPDTCEDCNGNQILDDQDISGGGSLDLNANGIPDECEPDCNNNNVPDDKDIADSTSTDLYGNGIPDECETDCDNDGTSDYTEIQLDMTLDIDRNAVLDACQDCDSNGTTDLEALGGAHNLWIASGLPGEPIREFYASTGVLTNVSTGALVNEGQDVIVTPSGSVLVSSSGDDRVMEFDPGGAYLGDFVASGAGGLSYPTGLALSPAGTLLVSSRDTDSVLEYDGSNGTPVGAFVASGAGGLATPFGLAFGPNGNLFVTSGTNEVLEYDGQTGAFVRVFVSSADNGGLDQPRGMTFKSDGNLLVTSFGTNELLEYERASGASLGKWAQVGTATVLTQISPWGVRVGPNGNVFMSRTGDAFGSGGGGKHEDDDEDDSIVIELHLTNAQVYEFDVRNGNFLRMHIGGNDHGLHFPTGFAFVPGWTVDCNLNLLPDSCDIASGFSQDANENGTPDECEVDCNGNGTQDRLDIVPLGDSLDCNLNGVPDECDPEAGDIALFVSLLLSDDPDPVLVCMLDGTADGLLDGRDVRPYVERLVLP